MYTNDPKKLDKRVELYQPTDAKNSTGNTTDEFELYATRYGGRDDTGGNDVVYNDQDVATRSALWVIRYDALVKPGWVLRHDGQDYHINAALDPDSGKKRFLHLITITRETITLAEA